MRTRLECKQFTDSSSLVDNDPDDGLFDSPGPIRLSACVCAIPGKLAHNELVVTLVNITSRQLHFFPNHDSPKPEIGAATQRLDWIAFHLDWANNWSLCSLPTDQYLSIPSIRISTKVDHTILLQFAQRFVGECKSYTSK